MKILSTIVISILAITSSFSQSIPFPDSIAMWKDQVDALCGDIHSSVLFNECHIFEMDGDTTINSVQYDKVYLYYDDDSILKRSFYTALRSDTNNKVYRYDTVFKKDYIIYDFNFTIGDSIVLTFPDSLSPNFTDTVKLEVQNVDTVFMYGKMRRRAHTYSPPVNGSSFGNYYWLEGVGSSMGLLYYELESTPETCIECKWLADFSLTRDIVYTCGDTNCFAVGINDITIEPLSFYPNPLQAGGSLTIDLEETRDVDLKIYNISGKCVWSSNHHSARQVVIQPNLSKGVYIIKIQSEDKIYTGKLTSF